MLLPYWDKILTEGATVLLIAPVWSAQEWYPILLELLVDVLPSISRPPERPFQQTTPSFGTSPPTCRLKGIRQKQLAQGISGRAADLTSAGWSREINMAYQSTWKRWTGWCNQQKVDPFSCNIKTFVNFLADLFEQGLQYRSINTIRSVSW